MISSKSPIQAALVAARNAATQQTQMAESVERLSSGLKINRAKDSASGFGIAQELQQQSRGITSSVRNAQDAISVARTTEGALEKVSALLLRMKELTVTGANETLGLEQRKAISTEISELREEMNAIVERTTYNGLSLLRGEYTKALEKVFGKQTGLVITDDKALSSPSTVRIGSTNETAGTPTWSSVISISDIRATARSGKDFTLTADRSSLTLTSTKDGISRSQTVTLVDTETPSGPNETRLSYDLNGITTLRFQNLGIEIDIKNNRVGNNHNTTEIATMVAGLGVTAKSELIDTWTSVEGAAWDHGQTGTIKAVVTATDGSIKLTTTTGLSAVTGYSGSLTDGTATQIAFSGSKANVDAALASLKMKSTNGKGQVDIQVIPANYSINTYQGVTSYYQPVSLSSGVSWSAARTAATSQTFDGHTGYLANITSSTEQGFIDQKDVGWGWIGASDSGSEGSWKWMDGPESSRQFWLGQAGGTVVNGSYENWAAGEPNEDRTAQWVTIDGANFDPGLPDATLKVFINASAGSNIRLLQTAGLSAVTGYTDSWTNGTADEIVFTGNRASISAALQSLQVYSNTGTADVTVSFSPSRLSVNSIGGITSFYEVIGSYTPADRKNWWDAKWYAEHSSITIAGVTYTGYLANITSAAENSFLYSKLGFDSWFGATDAASEGTWYWSGGPVGEKNVALTYSNWNAGEPNNSGGEDYAQFYATGVGAGRWNDLNGNSALSFIIEYNDGVARANPYSRTFNLDLSGEDDFGYMETDGQWKDYAIGVQNYIVEYQGAAQVTDKRNKTILLGAPSKISVDYSVSVDSVDTSKAEAGIYKLSANQTDQTVTLSKYDITGQTLEDTETVFSAGTINAGGSIALNFQRLGVSTTISNSSLESISLDGDEGGFSTEREIASNVTKTIMGRSGLDFQIGDSAKHTANLNLFRDLRLGDNSDAIHGEIFNQANELINSIQLNTSYDVTDKFLSLETRIEDLITVVNGKRSLLGAFQNQTDIAINNLNHQLLGLSDAKSQIQDTDFAWETARLTKLQIGQQAATAMLAQANAIPNVIMALIE